MESKKNPRVDLQNKGPVFVQIGLIVSLSVVLLAFEYKQFEKPLVLPPSDKTTTLLVETIIPTEQQPVKPNQPDMRLILTRIEIGNDDDPKLPDDIDWPDFNNYTLPPMKPMVTKTPPTPPEVLPPPRNVQELAKFPGGDDALFTWLGKQIIYPEIARKAGIEGKVFVRFVVELDGSITNIAIERGDLGGGCEEAAIEAVKKMPKWIPAKQRNHPVRSTFVLPVEFRLTH